MKKAVVALLVAVAVIAIAGIAAWNSLDLIVAWTLEHYGPKVTGVDVKVKQVRISPTDGKGEIRGLELGSPAGFSAPRSARLGEIRLSLDPKTLLDPVIHVHEVYVDAPTITYERGPSGANLDAIQASIDRYVRELSADAPSKSEKRSLREPRRFVIDRLVIKGARVVMTNAGLKGQGLNFDLPDIEMLGLGARQGGVTASAAASAVASALQRRIAQRLLTNLDALRKGGVEGAIDALKGLIK